MDKIIVEGGHKLSGTVQVSGAKNSALPILFATLLADGEHNIHNVPELVDIHSTLTLLEQLGCETSRDGKSVRVTTGAPP
ncbi:MAG: UDP-N-acetylglucosamine 1-carboxyvinyltransferase, partial [Bdellovibrionales bacterium]|nr:UDP-N-acetylglucosamine 1-carboxyvinyltransferase [Bdellovibrionales bacterium]